ncbi:hypothetical protein KEM56_004073, partial [Ascosphaera pollenicola]
TPSKSERGAARAEQALLRRQAVAAFAAEQAAQAAAAALDSDMADNPVTADPEPSVPAAAAPLQLASLGELRDSTMDDADDL